MVIPWALGLMVNGCHYDYIQVLRVNSGTEKSEQRVADAVDGSLQMQKKR